MAGLQLRTNFDSCSEKQIMDLKRLCNSFGVIPVCSDTTGLNNMKIYFGNDIRRKNRFAEGIERILFVKHDPKIRRQIFGKRMACPWKKYNTRGESTD